MIIDLHTHIFPTKIAKRTIEYLSKKGGIPPFSDGEADGLVRKMTEAGVDLAINLPVVTDPAQFESVNRFASEINEIYRDKERRIISFGGIHPACEDVFGKMRQIKEQGSLVTKEYVKGRENIYTHPAIGEYNKTATAANQTVTTLVKIIKELRDNESDAGSEILSFLRGE